MAHIRDSGHLTFLRAHRRGGGYGGSDNQIDVEIVGKLDADPDAGFGCTLREGEDLPSHQAMFDLLRDGFVHELDTTVEYETGDRKSNGIVFRVELRR
jgi:hypothetical protein